MASLPRPSKPTQNPPPTAPLPTIPIPKTRLNTNISPATTSPATPSSGLPTRSPPSSGVPSASNSTPSTPSSAQPSSAGPSQPLPALPGGKNLKKTTSYNVFPRSTNGATTPTSQQNPTPTTAIPASKRASSLYNPTPSRSLSARSSLGQPLMPARSLPTTPIVPNAFVDGKTPREDVEIRGRPTSTGPGKDKGNVVISVRVRPEGNHNEDSAATAAAAGEWMVDGRQSLVAYKGREGGDYFYGMIAEYSCICNSRA